MTRFADGPAQHRTLMLKRHPLFLRVTICGKTLDALDQLTDEPGSDEQLFAYRRVSRDGGAFIDWTEGGRRRGGYFPFATYAAVKEQPDDTTMRDRDKWRAWCVAEQKKGGA